MEKTAIILDTNIIRQYKDGKNLEILLENLAEQHVVYVPQIVIDERKEQLCREFEKGYLSVKKFYSTFGYALKKAEAIDINKASERLRTGIQERYEKAFPNRIIPFKPSKQLLEKIIERAYKKNPPFSNIDNASDKGFKDALIWHSVIEYFTNNGENEVVFITKDNGFVSRKEFLCEEFEQYTRKKLKIADDEFSKNIDEMGIPAPEKENLTPIPPNIEHIREKVQTTINNLCYVHEYDDRYYDGERWEKTFEIDERVDIDYMKAVFDSLRQKIQDNLFEKTLRASEILCLDNRVTNILLIPMENIQEALDVYEDVKANMPDFLLQFYSAAANIINQNFEAKNNFMSVDDDDDLPF